MRQGRFTAAKEIVDQEIEFRRYSPDLSERIVMALAENEFLDISYKIVNPQIPPIKRDYVVQSPTPLGQRRADESEATPEEPPKVDPFTEYPVAGLMAAAFFLGLIVSFFLVHFGRLC